jgi:hypothetical protein
MDRYAIRVHYRHQPRPVTAYRTNSLRDATEILRSMRDQPPAGMISATIHDTIRNQLVLTTR